MNILKAAFRFFRLALLGLLIIYWSVFLFYTLKNLVTGGPRAVALWYMQNEGGVHLPSHWSWSTFVLKQIVILAITLALCLYQGRTGRIESD